MKVLVVKTSSMGDVIHTLPALSDACVAFPDIRFDWVVEEGFAEIPRWHATVDRVIPVAIRRWRKNLLKTWRSGEWQAFKRELQAEQYDCVIDAQGLLKSAVLVTRLARGRKAGFDKVSARESLASRFYDQQISVSRQQHAVERTRQLFAAALGYQLPEAQGDFAIRQHFIKDGEQVAEKYLVFLHSTTRFDKHWPEEYWLELIQVATDAGWKIKLPWGNEQEHARAQRLAITSAVEVLPKLNLQQVTAVIAGTSACVSVDTGLSHMAAALDRPNIILFGPTDPGLVGGYGKDQISLESCNFEKSRTGIEPEVFSSLTPEIVWRELQKRIYS